jgi:hypothetical protein
MVSGRQGLPETRLIPRWTPRAPPYRDLQGTTRTGRKCSVQQRTLSTVTPGVERKQGHIINTRGPKVPLPRQCQLEHLRWEQRDAKMPDWWLCTCYRNPSVYTVLYTDFVEIQNCHCARGLVRFQGIHGDVQRGERTNFVPFLP